ncbi:MAG: chorismate synthase [Saprospiraceae bacterium]
MAGNTYGQLFRITTFGESHGAAIGVIIDGCPAGLDFDEAYLQAELARRRPGQSALVTQRKEPDTAEVLSGMFEGKTTGTPISLLIRNTNQKSKDYSHIATQYRPSHADYTYDAKYGHRDYRGGGRSSARETASRVAAAAFAKTLLATAGVHIQGFVERVGDITLNPWPEHLSSETIEGNPVRAATPETAELMEARIRDVRKAGDTIGGTVGCRVTGVPAGWGEPAFDKLHAELGKAMLSINACQGFEYGSGFAGTYMLGSAHNDAFEVEDGKVQTTTNRSGGIQGGISNGMPIEFRAAFKPVATIMQDQSSIDADGEAVTVQGKGRHDPCVLPRAVPIVEAMAALVLADFMLRHRASRV